MKTNARALVTEPEYELPTLRPSSESGYLVPLPVLDTVENSNVEYHADGGNNNEDGDVPGESGYVIPPSDESACVVPPTDESAYVIPPTDESHYEIMPI